MSMGRAVQRLLGSPRSITASTKALRLDTNRNYQRTRVGKKEAGEDVEIRETMSLTSETGIPERFQSVIWAFPNLILAALRLGVWGGSGGREETERL